MHSNAQRLDERHDMTDAPLTAQTSYAIWDIKNQISNVLVAMEKIYGDERNEATEISLQVCKAMLSYAEIMEIHFSLATRNKFHG